MTDHQQQETQAPRRSMTILSNPSSPRSSPLSSLSWVVDKPNTSVTWSKFASSCFCFPGFQQANAIAATATNGRSTSMSITGLGDYYNHHDIEESSLSSSSIVVWGSNEHQGRNTSINTKTNSITLGESIIFHTTESETSLHLAVSEDEDDHKNYNSINGNGYPHPPVMATPTASSLPPRPPVKKKLAPPSPEKQQQQQQSDHPQTPARACSSTDSTGAASGKPPVSPCKLRVGSSNGRGNTTTSNNYHHNCNNSSSSNNSYQSWNNQSLVTTAGSSASASMSVCSSFSSFSSITTTASNPAATAATTTTPRRKSAVAWNPNRNRSDTGDHSRGSWSLGSKIPPLPPQPPPTPLRRLPQQSQYPWVVGGRNRVDSEDSTLGMEEEEGNAVDGNDCKTPQQTRNSDSFYDNNDNDSVCSNSPFPLLEGKHAGDEFCFFSTPAEQSRSVARARRATWQVSAPEQSSTSQIKKASTRIEATVTPKNLAEEDGRQKKKRRRSRWPHKTKRQSSNTNKNINEGTSQRPLPTEFLCKNSIMEGLPISASTTSGKKALVVASGWIVVLFGPPSITTTTAHNNSYTGRSSQRTRGTTGDKKASSSIPAPLGFGAEDLYYLRVVEASPPAAASRTAPSSSTAATLVLYRSTDGSLAHTFPIERNWILDSPESDDRRVGRSVSIRRWCSGNGCTNQNSSSDCWIRMIPVALNDRWLDSLEARMTRTKQQQQHATMVPPIGTTARGGNDYDGDDSTTVTTEREETAHHSDRKQVFVLPNHGRFAPDAQLDTARHLFFTIDSFAKRSAVLLV